jgi:excisionase family DNA binding protein
MSIAKYIDLYNNLCNSMITNDTGWLKMLQDKDEKLVLSVEEARKLLGLSRGLTYEAIRNGEIPSIRIGHRILIPKVALERMLEISGTTIPGSDTTKASADYEECGARHRGTVQRTRGRKD